MNRDQAAQAVAEATAEEVGRHVPDDEWSDDLHSDHALDCVNQAIKDLNRVGHDDPENCPELWGHVIAGATVLMLVAAPTPDAR